MTTKRKLTDEQKKNYIEHDGYICPFCGSTAITAYDAFEAPSQKIECIDCGETWRDIYKLVDIE
jgi:hypothetical protein